jgi:hypothetical protein
VFFALVLLATLLRAEKSVANGALTVITFLAVAIAVAATVRSFGGVNPRGKADPQSLPQTTSSLPALSCLDGLAGDTVEAACEKALFATAESTAAAVSYTAGQIARLSSFGDLAAANAVMTPELSALRRTLERDHYGLVANVLRVRDGCTPTDCSFFKSLSDPKQIAANMIDRSYEGLIVRYASGWNNTNTNGAGAGANGPGAAGPTSTSATQPSVPAGRPLSGDFPNSSSIPPVSIMTAEPPTSSASAAPATAPKAAANTTQQTSRTAPVAPAQKKPPQQKRNAASPSGSPSPASQQPSGEN